ncbi:MAG: hypothetical protein RLN76_09550 [Phycisphaeraceae bacterium]
MGIFGLGGNKQSKDGGSGASSSRDPRKAVRFFEHADTVASAGNYDYAIDLFINGLRHDPANMNRHEDLRDVALKRKLAGGKPAGFAAKLSSGGSTKLEKMLSAEKLWAMSPLDARLMRDVMKLAVEADAQEDDETNLAEVAYWMGVNAMEQTSTKPDKGLYMSLQESFAKIGAYAKSVEACKRAIGVAPNDAKLFELLRNLEAEKMISGGQFGAGEQGDFRSNLKDADAQATLQAEGQLRVGESEQDQIIAKRRAEWEETPEDSDKLTKLIDVLLKTEQEDHESEAIELLNKAWEDVGQYRFKMRAGDIKMKQMARQSRILKQMAQDKSPEAIAEFQENQKQRLAFELGEYEERSKNYPTDMGIRYEYGRRLFQAGRFDDAIGAFQQAKADAKHRAQSHLFLGQCYLKKSWNEEAVDTLHEGIESHKLQDDRLALDLRYLLMEALTLVAEGSKKLEAAKEAQKVASGILQTDISYRDIQARMEKIRELVKTLEAASDE